MRLVEAGGSGRVDQAGGVPMGVQQLGWGHVRADEHRALGS